MSEPLAKERPTVDLDDFERRLRQNDHSHDDPLAELARLVGEHQDPYDDVFAQEAAAHKARQADPYQEQARREPAFSTGFSPRLSGDFAAIEAGLRGGIAAHDERGAYDPSAGYNPSADHEFYAQNEAYPHDHQAYPHDQAYADDQGYAPEASDQQWAPARSAPAASRSRRSVYAMAATIAVGVIGVGVAFAYKGTSSSPREIKTIMAAAGPSKIQPPAETSNDQGAQDAAILGNNSKQPTQLVSREEQPVDLSQAVQNNTSRDADAGPAPGDAASIPVPPSPSQARGETPPTPETPDTKTSAAPADQMPSFGMSDMPAPKRVKVVSVRPDGTILSNDQPPAAAIPAPRQAQSKTSDRAGPVAKASTPHIAASTKTTSRITTPKPTDVASADPDQNGGDAAPAPKPTRKAKPQHVASAEATPDATDSTASLPAASSGGGFAVQLAAPGSEADARSASSRFSKKFAEALAGHRIGFKKAQSNGKSVFRVRVDALSRAEAVSLCEKLKAQGGTCFVAKS